MNMGASTYLARLGSGPAYIVLDNLVDDREDVVRTACALAGQSCPVLCQLWANRYLPDLAKAAADVLGGWSEPQWDVLWFHMRPTIARSICYASGVVKEHISTVTIDETGASFYRRPKRWSPAWETVDCRIVSRMVTAADTESRWLRITMMDDNHQLDAAVKVAVTLSSIKRIHRVLKVIGQHRDVCRSRLRRFYLPNVLADARCRKEAGDDDESTWGTFRTRIEFWARLNEAVEALTAVDDHQTGGFVPQKFLGMTLSVG